MKYERFTLIAFAMASLAAALIWAAWATIAAPGELKAEHWLGLAGNLIGGGMTLVAAIVAWAAVRSQNSEQRKTVEVHRQDAANLRLTAHMTTIFQYRAAFDQTVSHENRNKRTSLEELQQVRRSPAMLALMMEPLIGKDTDAVMHFLAWAEVAAMRHVTDWGDRDDGRRQEVTYLLYNEIVECITERRTRMRLNGVDSLTELRLIDVHKYVSYINGGAPLWDRPGA